MRKFFDELRTNLPDSSKNELETALSDRLNARANAVEPDQSGQFHFLIHLLDFES